jgi:hypothetical protein
MTEHWMTDYEKAHQAANGCPAKVVICGGGWYRITRELETGIRYRKSQIIEMTARLEKRVHGENKE